jgi:high-affinity Fe2+/Pb2+ permease
MKLSTRLTIAMVALVLFTAAAVALFTYRDLEAAILPGAFAVLVAIALAVLMSRSLLRPLVKPNFSLSST